MILNEVNVINIAVQARYRSKPLRHDDREKYYWENFRLAFDLLLLFFYSLTQCSYHELFWFRFTRQNRLFYHLI